MSSEAAFSIADLARLSGVNVRTIRYYLAQGLLPASGESGPGAHYGDGHLNRLLLTRRLQEQHLPLAEIRRRLADLTDAEVAMFVAAPPEPERATASSALDYVRTVLGTAPAWHSDAPATPATAAVRAPSLLRRAVDAARLVVAETPETPAMRPMRYEPADAPASLAASASATPPPAAEPPGPERSQWERLSLGPNVEIHVRRPLSRAEQRRVERLITIARQVLKEESQ